MSISIEREIYICTKMYLINTNTKTLGSKPHIYYLESLASITTYKINTITARRRARPTTTTGAEERAAVELHILVEWNWIVELD